MKRKNDLIVVSVVRDQSMYEHLVVRNAYLNGCDIVKIDNSVENRTIPYRYNRFIESDRFPEDGWVAFVHEDFEFLEDPRVRLATLDRNAIYGVAGLTEDGRARLAILNSHRDGSHLIYCGYPYDEVREVSTVDCMCLIVHSSLVRRLGLRFDENLTFDLYTEVFSADARERHDVRTFVVPIMCRHWSFGKFSDRFYRQLEYVRGRFATARRTYCSTTAESFGAKAGPVDRKRTGWGRHNIGPFRVKMTDAGIVVVRFLGLKIFRRDYHIAQLVRGRVLAVVHVYYPELWPEIRACLANIRDDLDLIVTYVDEAAVAEARRDYPQAKFVRCENRGFDVWPFLKVLQGVQLSDYDYVVKLHTKRNVGAWPELGLSWGFGERDSAWREALLSFCRTPENWRKTKIALRRPGVGMVADAALILGRRAMPKCRAEFDQAAQRLGLPPRAKGRFVAGSMFAARAECLEQLGAAGFSGEDFDVTCHDYRSVLAHVVERMLGLCVYRAGLRIAGYEDTVLSRVRLQLRRWSACLVRFLYQEKITSKGYRLIKICKITVWHQKVHWPLPGGFDQVVSLGAECASAMLLNKVGLRLASGPLDWLTGAPFQTRIDTLCRRFSDFLVRENIVWMAEGQQDRASDVYRDSRLGYVFIHDFPKNIQIDESFAAVKAKYDRRIARLLKYLEAGERVCLVWRDVFGTLPDEACEAAVKALQRAYPLATIGLLILDHDPAARRGAVDYRTLAGSLCVKAHGNFMPEGSDILLGDSEMACRVLRRIPRSAVLRRRCRIYAFKRRLVHLISLWHLTRAGRKRSRAYWTGLLCKSGGGQTVGW